MVEYYDKYKSQGFEVLGFPCNQFGAQGSDYNPIHARQCFLEESALLFPHLTFLEPGTNSQIKAFAASKFGVKFPMFSKIDVNGPNTHPLFLFLKTRSGGADVAWLVFSFFFLLSSSSLFHLLSPTSTQDSP